MDEKFIRDIIVKKTDIENHWQDLLDRIDILVDGPFETEKKSYDLLFKGSSNQRIIDVKKSIASNTVVLAEI